VKCAVSIRDGTLRGIVVDENDAVIPAVNVAVINISRGILRHSTTDQSGDFTVPLLPPGSYTVKAEREGFNTTEVRDVVLNVNDQMSVKDNPEGGTHRRSNS